MNQKLHGKQYEIRLLKRCIRDVIFLRNMEQSDAFRPNDECSKTMKKYSHGSGVMG
jgi:hypothetical protein